jgi:iron(III) transport system substrate-binding protein
MRRLAYAILLAWALVTPAAAQERDARLLERAKGEGSVSLFTSMQLVDSRPLTEAFERKYGIRVALWRASGEKVAQRAVTEARGARHEVDVVETDGAQMEILHREKQLAPFFNPSLSLYVLAYNTKLVAPSEVPNSYEDLLNPRWAGRVGIEAADVAWFAAVAKAMSNIFLGGREMKRQD